MPSPWHQTPSSRCKVSRSAGAGMRLVASKSIREGKALRATIHIPTRTLKSTSVSARPLSLGRDRQTWTRRPDPERNSSSLLLLLRLQRADQQEGEGARVDLLTGSGRQRTVRSLLCGPEGLTSCSGRIPVLARCAAVATLSLKRCGGWPAPVLQRRSVAPVDTRAEPSLLPHGGTKGAIEISDVDR